MAVTKGVLASLAISLTSIPLVLIVTSYDVLSRPLILMVIGFSFLLIVAAAIILIIPPTQQDGEKEGRGLVYYTSCLFLWASVADLTIQSRHLELFGITRNTKYIVNAEPYLSTPFGITTQLWNAIFNSFLYLIIIFQIDNQIDCKFTVIYWCGNILTSQFVVLVSLLTGFYSDNLSSSLLVYVVFLFLPGWIFYKYMHKSSYKSATDLLSLSSTFYDKALCLLLLFLSIFGTVRGLGALGSNFPLIKSYVDNFEPYIKEPSKFGSTWALYTTFYGVPFNLVAIYALLRPGCAWMLNWSVFYASGMLQGTFTYMSYSWYSISDPNYRIPKQSFADVVFLNVLLVIVAHLLMVRCLSRSEYFTRSKIEEKSSKEA